MPLTSMPAGCPPTASLSAQSLTRLSSAISPRIKRLKMRWCVKVPISKRLYPRMLMSSPCVSAQSSLKAKSLHKDKFPCLVRQRKICFIIGGSFGMAESVKQRADMRLGMSEMTFPHHLARVMLTEQIYRSFKIIEGSRYHK